MRRHSFRVWHALHRHAVLAGQYHRLALLLEHWDDRVQCPADPDQGRGSEKAREAGIGVPDLGLETGTTAGMSAAEAGTGTCTVSPHVKQHFVEHFWLLLLRGRHAAGGSGEAVCV